MVYAKDLSSQGNSTSSAFTVIELVGVLAIITIIGAAVYAVAIRRIDLAAKTKEFNDLGAISNALVLQILTTKRIPSETTWSNEVASWASVPISKVVVNPRRNNRRLLVDPNGWFATNALPWSQPLDHTNVTVLTTNSARLLLISSLGPPLPLQSDLPSRPANFQQIWDTAPDVTPASWTTFWKGKGEDLLIQRIQLNPLFHKLVLANRDPTAQPRFSMESSLSTNLSTGVHEYAFLTGTDVGLMGSDGKPQRRLLLTRDETFSFIGNSWEGGSNTSDELLAQDFADLAYQFMGSGASLAAFQGADPQGPVVGMFNFMLIYSMWAGQCPAPAFPLHDSNNPSTVPEFVLMLDIAGSGNSSFLQQWAGTGGLLKPPGGPQP